MKIQEEQTKGIQRGMRLNQYIIVLATIQVISTFFLFDLIEKTLLYGFYDPEIMGYSLNHMLNLGVIAFVSLFCSIFILFQAVRTYEDLSEWKVPGSLFLLIGAILLPITAFLISMLSIIPAACAVISLLQMRKVSQNDLSIFEKEDSNRFFR